MTTDLIKSRVPVIRRCERCSRAVAAGTNRVRCMVCRRLVCRDCADGIGRGQRHSYVWCRLRDSLGRILPNNCPLAPKPS